jgi:hypothetical protein
LFVDLMCFFLDQVFKIARTIRQPLARLQQRNVGYKPFRE